jgi:hypothetical protein
MDAHKEMTDQDIDYDNVKAAAEANGRSIGETVDIMQRTIAKDQGDHASEYTTD